MVSPLSAFLTSSNALSMVDALFQPLSAQDTGTAAANTATPSVSSTSSSSDKVTSAAIAAIQALVKGGTSGSSASTASAATQDSQSLPDWYTATGTTTFTPLNSTKSVTMPTDEYDWYKDGVPQTLDEVKSQFYKTNTADTINSLIDQNQSILTQAVATGNSYLESESKAQIASYSSLLNAIKTGTVQVSLLDPSVACQDNSSVIRDGSGHIVGNSMGGNIDWAAVDNVYNVSNGSQNYEIGTNPFINGYVISWPKN
jgi:hypothetical protein